MSQKAKNLLDIIKNKSSGTVAIFADGDRYKCFSEDATFIANAIFVSEVGLKKVSIGTEEILCLSMNAGQYTRVVRDLILLLGYRVELYDEKNGRYNLKAKGNLGNLGDFEDIVSSAGVELNDVSTVMCVSLSGDDSTRENILTILTCNPPDLRITVARFNDSEHFSLFEQCVVALNPRECIFLQKESFSAQRKYKQLGVSLQRSNVQKVIIEGCMDHSESICRSKVQAILKKQFKEFDQSVGVHVIYSLLNYMQLLDDEKYMNSFSLINYASTGYMYVSYATLCALDVFTVGSDNDSFVSKGVACSLYEHLNRCRTHSGRRLLREWMRRPLFDFRLIQERLDVVEALFTNTVVRQRLYTDILKRIPDISYLTRRLIQKKSTLQDVYKTYQLAQLLPLLVEVLQDLNVEMHQSAIKALFMEPLEQISLQLEPFSACIESAVDISYAEKCGRYRIKPEIDPELFAWSEELEKIEQRLEEFQMKSKLNCDSIKLESRDDGYFFRVTLNMEKLIRGKVKIIETTKGSGILFRSLDLEQINEEYCELNNAYENKQKLLTSCLIETCAGYVPVLNSLSERIGIIDALLSFAVVASTSSSPYVRPQLLEKGSNVFDLVQCRHPVLEQTPIEYIPNDVRLRNENDDSQTRFVVLTGANMGGKSTYLKSAALTVFLAQIGCFVPCSEARFSVVDGIFTRVGASDSQFKGISTFMAEMMDCAYTLETATEHSLIIIDELGRGTSTYDGFGLAWAIAEEIITRIKCVCLFATHFHELSKLQQKYPTEVENLKVETLVNPDDGTLTILYQVSKGVADQSFGINIAKLLFPASIVAENFKKEICRVLFPLFLPSFPLRLLSLLPSSSIILILLLLPYSAGVRSLETALNGCGQLVNSGGGGAHGQKMMPEAALAAAGYSEIIVATSCMPYWTSSKPHEGRGAFCSRLRPCPTWQFFL
ncbi:mutS domain V domain-containing protein [Ditylenchus destructor]|nr:mutS domain V domain-containing protein [Ditylenchus destructor]